METQEKKVLSWQKAISEATWEKGFVVGAFSMLAGQVIGVIISIIYDLMTW